ncbi:MAG: methyltransferase domain-containing protein [Candidatus Sungbacteria bacterium]|nr:methyltransferase domain-containing protein [Candidatus Sungbacteria bacterium]
MGSIPDQKTYWEREYARREAFTRIYSDMPSQPVVELVDFFVKSGLPTSEMHVIDAGCGIGRNSAYLRKCGLKVTGVDFIPGALQEARRKYGDLGIQFDFWDLSKKWPLHAQSVDAIIDCNTTISLGEAQREEAIREAYRVLKKRGYYLFYGVGISPEFMERHPGPEPNSVLMPNGRFEKRYSEDELLEAYAGHTLIDIEVVSGSDVIDGQPRNYPLWVVLFYSRS